MTEAEGHSVRKPAGVSFEAWIDSQIRLAQERGDFTDLPGAGKPIKGLDEPHDENWWVRQKLQREGITVTPPTLKLRKEVADLPARLGGVSDEVEVRRIVAEINERIRDQNRKPPPGPPTTLAPLDIDGVVVRWRAAQEQ